MVKDRKHHFYEGAGNPIVGYSTDEGTICRSCGSDNPEMATFDPKDVDPIHLDNVGEGSDNPDGFTCVGCGEVVGSWDYEGGA